MYVLDPLEVHPRAQVPVLGGPPVNVAIALGSMARALQQPELDVAVRGTWKFDELTGDASLEVIFALREVSGAS